MVNDSFTRYVNDFFRDMTGLGSGYIIGGFGLIFLLLGQVDNFFRVMFILFATYGLSAVVRLIYFKERPAKQKYSDFIGRIDASSFPSVHTGRVVSTGMLLYGILPELLSLIVLVGGIVMYSRIHLKKHDLMDVMGGILLGGVVFWLMGLVI